MINRKSKIFENKPKNHYSYEDFLSIFYILRSDLKFKGYELILVPEINKESTKVIVKQLMTGKKWEMSIDNVLMDVDSFIIIRLNQKP